MTVIDLYAGPGGWDLGALACGIEPIGIELDADTCATRAAAGLHTIRAAVGQYWPKLANLEGLIASPPCPAFSAAGDHRGRADIAELVDWLDSGGSSWDCWWPYAAARADAIVHDSMLLAEPLAWVDRWEPTWIAMEQVREVAPFWDSVARWLDKRGYSTWSGLLCAADYGVPQERYRAFLIAHRDRVASPPSATHAKNPQPTLFGPELLPWVTMAEALGLADGVSVDSGQNSKAAGGTTRRYVRSADRPASTLTTHSVRQWVLNQYDERTNETGDGPRRPARSLEETAPTITTKVNRWEWMLNTRERYKPLRTLDEPSPTVHGTSKNAVKVSIEQAAALQSFPIGYPWQGSKTSAAKQIGNAVPPLLAAHILHALTGE